MQLLQEEILRSVERIAENLLLYQKEIYFSEKELEKLEVISLHWKEAQGAEKRQ